MSHRVKIRNQSGLEVLVDIGVDCDQRTFDARVKSGEYTVVVDEPKRAPRSK